MSECCWLRGECGTSLVRESICCDTADQKDESQSSAAETDGRSDTYEHKKVGRADRPTLGCRSNAITNWREGLSVACVSLFVCEATLYMAKTI